MTNGNESAFARPASEYTVNGTLPDGNDAVQATSGLSKREYFAAMAMNNYPDPAYIENEQAKDRRANPYNEMTKPAPRTPQQIIAAWRVAEADALIEALNTEAK